MSKFKVTGCSKVFWYPLLNHSKVIQLKYFRKEFRLEKVSKFALVHKRNGNDTLHCIVNLLTTILSTQKDGMSHTDDELWSVSPLALVLSEE